MIFFIRAAPLLNFLIKGYHIYRKISIGKPGNSGGVHPARMRGMREEADLLQKDTADCLPGLTDVKKPYTKAKV